MSYTQPTSTLSKHSASIGNSSSAPSLSDPPFFGGAAGDGKRATVSLMARDRISDQYLSRMVNVSASELCL
jgi:hypothetical protein